MSSALRLFAISLALMSSAVAHDIITTNLTFTRDISRIFDQRCVSCHGEKSTVPLTSYEQVRPWAVDIKEQVLSRAMPPWGAVKGFGSLQPDHALSQEEIMIIAGWVIGGAPKGDPALLSKNSPVTTAPLAMRDALLITNRVTLSRPLAINGIRPVESQIISSVKIIAKLPDGRIEPLVWLYRYDPKNSHAFHFRQLLMLPAQTIVESSAPLHFALEAP
ncbi:MAG: cytochrome c [Acidobacteriota bacterium]|nr:cytochrome c [Acidobacteriota bacterium]